VFLLSLSLSRFLLTPSSAQATPKLDEFPTPSTGLISCFSEGVAVVLQDNSIEISLVDAGTTEKSLEKALDDITAISISAGERFICALDAEDGTPHCIGAAPNGEADTPSFGLTTLSAGDTHVVCI